MLNSEIRLIADTHAEWLRSGGVSGRRADFSGLDLSMADFSDMDFSDGLFVGTRLERANLSGCNLARGDFRGAHLVCANLARANLHGADLTGVHAAVTGFENAVLSNTILDKANFDGARFVRADLSKTRGRLVKFNRSNLAHANLNDAFLEDVQFIKANLTNASVCGSTFWGIALLGATVFGVDFGMVAKIDDVESGEDLLHRSVKPEDVVLSRLQLQRLKRLRKKRFGVGEISRKIKISRSVVQAKLDTLDEEEQVNLPFATNRYLTKMFSQVGKLAFITAGCSITIVLLTGAVDVFRFISQQVSTGLGGYWYFLWLTLCLVSVAVGIYMFIRRERLIQDISEFLVQQKAETSNVNLADKSVGDSIQSGTIAEIKGAS